MQGNTDAKASASTRLAALIARRLEGLGLRRVILLGSAEEMDDSQLKHEMARRGVQVLVPPAGVRPWLDQLCTEGASGEQPTPEDLSRLSALVLDGFEHGVEAIVLLSEGYAGPLKAACPEARLVLCWDLQERAQALSDIVFDMGGVLLRWEPLRMARAVCSSEDDARLLADAVFGSAEWLWQDAGAVDEDTVAWTAKTRVPERLHEAVERLVYHWHDARDFMPETGELLAQLKASGYGVYLLSNAGESFRTYCEQIPGWKLFDGVVVSCFEHVVKPDARIFRILLERYGLEASSCLFVDDTEKNVLGAERVGMQGWLFDGDVEALTRHILG